MAKKKLDASLCWRIWQKELGFAPDQQRDMLIEASTRWASVIPMNGAARLCVFNTLDRVARWFPEGESEDPEAYALAPELAHAAEVVCTTAVGFGRRTPINPDPEDSQDFVTIAHRVVLEVRRDIAAGAIAAVKAAMEGET